MERKKGSYEVELLFSEDRSIQELLLELLTEKLQEPRFDPIQLKTDKRQRESGLSGTHGTGQDHKGVL